MRSALSVKRSRMTQRWRTIAILAVGAVIGTMVTATPVYGHVGGTVGHLWTKHIRPLADARYVNVGEKASDADTLDGHDVSEFSRSFYYACPTGQFLRIVGRSFNSSSRTCAGDATTAATATNADSVDGVSAATFNFNVSGSSGPLVLTRLFSGGGLTLDAFCNAESGNDSLTVWAKTDTDDSYIRTDLVGAQSDPDWDKDEGGPGDSIGGSHLIWFASNEDKAGTFVYRRGGSTDLQAQVLSVTLAWDIDGLGCELVGTVIGRH